MGIDDEVVVGKGLLDKHSLNSLAVNHIDALAQSATPVTETFVPGSMPIKIASELFRGLEFWDVTQFWQNYE